MFLGLVSVPICPPVAWFTDTVTPVFDEYVLLLPGYRSSYEAQGPPCEVPELPAPLKSNHLD